MSASLLIVGSGPAAAGAALAATERDDVSVTIIDIGGRLDVANEAARGRLAERRPEEWRDEDLATITQQPVRSDLKGLPEKRAFGSDFPFRDFGQRGTISADGVNAAIVSGAYGGFSNAWGAQFMPFTDATFRDWPVGATEMERHYRAILARIPFAAEEDDLATMFPLLGEGRRLPPLSARSAATLARYERGRGRLNRAGVMVGKARLAFDAEECVRCGLCMTGCPYGLIYSAAQTIDALRSRSRIVYHDGLLALEVEEDGRSATVVAREIEGGRLRRFTADRVLIACGAVGTARLVMASRRQFDVPLSVQESRQFRLPFLSRGAVADPRTGHDFTLNQFNMVVTHDTVGRDVSQLHFYTYNPAFVEALPALLRHSRAARVRAALLARLSVALGYLPSWASPSFSLRITPPRAAGEPSGIKLESGVGERPPIHNRMLQEVIRRVSAAAPTLDLWPVLPALRMSAGGKSYHWGGIFPHALGRGSGLSTDALGRLDEWRRIHLVDSSVFPSVPATTFALTVMANAHRIAEGALEEPA
jgi:choline dehydrogenase-like flavoprotein